MAVGALDPDVLNDGTDRYLGHQGPALQKVTDQERMRVEGPRGRLRLRASSEPAAPDPGAPREIHPPAAEPPGRDFVQIRGKWGGLATNDPTVRDARVRVR